METKEINSIKCRLWIDDIRPDPEGWTLAKNISEAIKAIEMFNPTEISLDHDISHPVKVGKVSRPYPCDECFCAVARFIVYFYRTLSKVGEDVKPQITIHTANPEGAKDLQAILKDFKTTYIPCPPCNRLESEV